MFVKKKTAVPREKRMPTMLEALSSIAFLVICFGTGAFLGLNYTPLMVLVAGYATFIAFRCGYTWSELEPAAADRIRKAVPVLTLFLAVGALVGAFMFSGTLPMFIYYGLQLVSPKWIALSSFLLCAVFSLFTGTSNGSVSTAGLAMMSLAITMDNVNLGLVAGACFAGSMFGDKISPISDSTVLSAAVTNNDVFDHIRHQSKTVMPAVGASIVIYFIYGISAPASIDVMSEATVNMMNALNGIYKWNIILLLPLIAVLWGGFSRKPPNLVLFSSAFFAMLIGVFYQGFSIQDGVTSLYGGFNAKMILTAQPDFVLSSLDGAAATLINRGGISSMLRTFSTCFIAMYFAGISEKSGVLQVLLDKVLRVVQGRGTLILASGFSVMFLSAVGGSSTVGQIITAELFNEKYEKMGLHTLNLARALEDFGTGSNGFFPWTSSGLLYASVLGVSNLTFLRYSYMSWIIWALAIFYAFSGLCIKSLDKKAEPYANV